MFEYFCRNGFCTERNKFCPRQTFTVPPLFPRPWALSSMVPCPSCIVLHTTRFIVCYWTNCTSCKLIHFFAQLMIVGKDMALINQTIIVFPGTLGSKSNHFTPARNQIQNILQYHFGILAWPRVQLWKKKYLFMCQKCKCALFFRLAGWRRPPSSHQTVYRLSAFALVRFSNTLVKMGWVSNIPKCGKFWNNVKPKFTAR